MKDLLNGGLDYPLILLSAPAGFGKCTLLSAWLETRNLPHAWIALDEADNDLGAFQAYFLAAFQIHFPGALSETKAFWDGVSLPNEAVIARSLSKELGSVDIFRVAI